MVQGIWERFCSVMTELLLEKGLTMEKSINGSIICSKGPVYA